MPASRRVSPSERFRAQLDELFDSGRELGQVLEEVARLGVRLLFQVALEAEVTEFLGRDRYARGERAHEGPAERLLTVDGEDHGRPDHARAAEAAQR